MSEQNETNATEGLLMFVPKDVPARLREAAKELFHHSSVVASQARQVTEYGLRHCPDGRIVSAGQDWGYARGLAERYPGAEPYRRLIYLVDGIELEWHGAWLAMQSSDWATPPAEQATGCSA